MRDVSRPITASMYNEVYDPVKDAYGFELDSDEDELSDICNEESVTRVESHEKDELPPPVQPIQPEPVFATDDLSAIASKLNPEDISDYLRYLKLDQYVEEFLNNEVDGDTMYDINDDILESMSVDTKKDRIKIKSKFKQWLRKKIAET